MNEASTNITRDSPLAIQYELLLQIYQHHFALLITGFAVYLAAVGVIAGYTFQPTVNTTTRTALLLFVVITSSVCVGALISVRVWLRELTSLKLQLEAALGLYAFPFSAARRVSLAITWLVLMVGALAAGLALYIR
jgi:hypothetical protein